MNQNFTIALEWQCLSSWTALAHAWIPSRSHEGSTAYNTHSHSTSQTLQLSLHNVSYLEKDTYN